MPPSAPLPWLTSELADMTVARSADVTRRCSSASCAGFEAPWTT
jgi:hypothetical protein